MDYCKKCGAELKDKDFCAECGAQIEEIPEVEKKQHLGFFKWLKKRAGVIIAVITTVAIVVGALFLIPRTPKDVAQECMKAVVKGNAKKIVKLYPKKVLNYVVDEQYEGDKSKLVDDIQAKLDKYEASFEFRDVEMNEIAYRIKDTDKLEGTVLDDYEKQYADIDLQVLDGKEVEIEITYPDGEDKKTESIYFNVVKIGLSWYII